MRTWRPGSGTLGLVFLVASCEGHRGLIVHDVRDAAPSTAGVALDELIPGYLAANCQRLVKCRLWPSIELCEADLFPTYLRALQDTIAAVGAGRIHYDPGAALACFDAVVAEACALSASAPACASVFLGTVPDGGRCVVNDECVGRLCGNYPAGASCCALGTCLPRIAAGSPCWSTDHCVDGYYCGGGKGTDPGTCQPLLLEGQACSTQMQCGPALQCDRGGTGTCRSVLQNGQACSMQVPACDPIAGFCDPVGRTCQPWRDVGAACSASVTEVSGGCVGYAACMNGTCVELPGIDEPCVVPDGGDPSVACRSGWCTDGTCQEIACPVCTIESVPIPDASIAD
jgi:hypothetical protein